MKLKSVESGLGSGRGVGRGQPGKTRITIRIDNEVLDWFRERVEAKGGGSYQALINEALKKQIEQGSEGLEALLRRIIREEMGKEASGEGSLFSLPPGKL